MSEYSHLVRFLPAIDYAKVVELGSRDGIDTLWLQNFFEAEIVAWECNPEAIEICRQTLAGKDRVTLVEKAAWSETKTLTFRPVTNGNLGASSVYRANPDYPYETYEQDEIEVPAMRLDEWWGNSEHWDEPIDLLIIDLQGAELEALRGAGELLWDIEAIITEGQNQPIYEDIPSFDELVEFLEGYGFELSVSIAQNDWFGDHIFTRKH